MAFLKEVLSVEGQLHIDHSWEGVGFARDGEQQMVVLQCCQCGEQKRVQWEDFIAGKYDRNQDLKMTEGFGVNRRGNAILCRAWGETERADVCVAKTLEEIAEFIVYAWTGDREDPQVGNVLDRLQSHDWDDEQSIDWEFEMGGFSMEDVCV